MIIIIIIIIIKKTRGSTQPKPGNPYILTTWPYLKRPDPAQVFNGLIHFNSHQSPPLSWPDPTQRLSDITRTHGLASSFPARNCRQRSPISPENFRNTISPSSLHENWRNQRQNLRFSLLYHILETHTLVRSFGVQTIRLSFSVPKESWLLGYVW